MTNELQTTHTFRYKDAQVCGKLDLKREGAQLVRELTPEIFLANFFVFSKELAQKGVCMRPLWILACGVSVTYIHTIGSLWFLQRNLVTIILSLRNKGAKYFSKVKVVFNVL